MNEIKSMRRSEPEHVIRASGEIADDDEIIVIGSQAILGQFPDAPVSLLTSMETDVYPKNKPELAGKVDGAIGEGSSLPNGAGLTPAKIPHATVGAIAAETNFQ